MVDGVKLYNIAAIVLLQQEEGMAFLSSSHVWAECFHFEPISRQWIQLRQQTR
jgi:hypothetical protein